MKHALVISNTLLDRTLGSTPNEIVERMLQMVRRSGASHLVTQMKPLTRDFTGIDRSNTITILAKDISGEGYRYSPSGINLGQLSAMGRGDDGGVLSQISGSDIFSSIQISVVKNDNNHLTVVVYIGA